MDQCRCLIKEEIPVIKEYFLGLIQIFRYQIKFNP